MRTQFYLHMVRRPGERVADYATRLRTVISGKKSLPDTEVGWLFKEKLMMLDALQQLLDMALQDAEAYGTIHTLATRTLRWTAGCASPSLEEVFFGAAQLAKGCEA